MKNLILVLIALLTTGPAFAANDYLKNNRTIVGSKGSAADKVIEFEQNAGANNPLIYSVQSALSLVLKTAAGIVGRGSAENITFLFDKGSGSNNPGFRWNNSSTVMQFSHGGGTWKTINKGTDLDSTGASSGTVPTADGSGGTSWQSPVSGVTDAVITKTGDYTILTSDFSGAKKLLVKCNCSSACTQTLPAASSTGYEVTVVSTGAGVCSLARAGSDLIHGATSLAVGTQYSAQTIQADGGTDWHIKGSVDNSKQGFAGSGADSTATVGNYTNYLFTTTGSRTFTVTRGGYCKMLLVGGGGGGGWGGGGGGGVVDHYFADVYVKPGTYTINVGAGGSAGTGAGTSGGTGGDTTAFGFTAKGGGGGGTYYGPNTAAEGNGKDGGSGGGAGLYNFNSSIVYGTGGAGTYNKPEDQGKAGAAGRLNTCHASAGGGGAGTAGSQGSCTGGTGGDGIRSMIKGTVGGDYFGGGGSGGSGNSGGSCAGGAASGGLGGGGGQNGSGAGVAGTANTGGGGAGGCSANGSAGGAGGSGIAIIACQTSF